MTLLGLCKGHWLTTTPTVADSDPVRGRGKKGKKVMRSGDPWLIDAETQKGTWKSPILT